MLNRKVFLHAVLAQVLICFWIFVKIFFLPYLIWKLLGTSPLAARIGDLSVIAMGTLAALTMGVIGYWHAARYPVGSSRVGLALLSMFFIHAPLFLFLIYKWMFGSAWDTYWSLYLSGWLSIVTHPMILVGFYGEWVDVIGTILLCGCYLAGVWMYFDESKDFRVTRIKSR
ncbi:hypothetical protein [Effusibacillus consociatus]|uniref:Uncharacterized protein n=1 Tax=Effusibacillus consociatus TaxID=1117041 RepID=A0ABV9Q522_9BACL